MRVSVDECPAGQAMDAAVAKALGHEVVLYDGRYVVKVAADSMPGVDNLYYDVKPYSISIGVAWGLVEREHMRLGWTEDWDVPYAACRHVVCYADEHPLAICRVFLKANGVEVLE